MRRGIEMYTKTLIANALQSGATATGPNAIAANDYLRQYAPDKRYRLTFLARAATWAHNETGIVLYRGAKYYYEQTKECFLVEKHR